MKNRKFKSAIYAVISDPQEGVIEGFFESIHDADVVSIVGHKLSARDAELLRDLCRSTLLLNTDICVEPMRFDLLRNFALAQLPSDTTVAVSLDADERLDDGWHEELDRASNGVQEALFSYHYTDPQFQDLRYLKTNSSRIHTRHGFHYFGATHEFLIPTVGENIPVVATSVEVRHQSSRANFDSKVDRYARLMNQDSQDLDIIHFNHEFRSLRQLLWSRKFETETVHKRVESCLRRISEKPDTAYWKNLKDEFLAVGIFSLLADTNGSVAHQTRIARNYEQMSDRSLYDIDKLIEKIK